MRDVAKEIQEILERRSEYLPNVQKEIGRLRTLDTDICQLESFMRELFRQQKAQPELMTVLEGIHISDLRKGIADGIGSLRTVEARFSRKTINIGVSGRARVGKSTLLQGISGLTEQQIPTGKGLPVTAVRSKIYHSSSFERAIYSGPLGQDNNASSLRGWPVSCSGTALPRISVAISECVVLLYLSTILAPPPQPVR